MDRGGCEEGIRGVGVKWRGNVVLFSQDLTTVDLVRYILVFSILLVTMKRLQLFPRLHIGCGTWDSVNWSPPRSLDIAVDPLHLLASGLVISEGDTTPFPHLRGAALFGSGAGTELAVSPFRCFLFPISPTFLQSLQNTYFRRLLSSITHLMPSMVQFEHVTSPSAVM